jgi:hypothetical protein
MQRILRSFTGLSDQSQELAEEVERLKKVVAAASAACAWEYFELVTLRALDPLYARNYVDSCQNDLVEFNNFSRQLHGPNFKNRYVYRAWYYIKALVVKYTPPGDGMIERLEGGAKASIRFRLSQFLGSPPKAASKGDRPERKVTEDEWNSLPQTSLNQLLDRAVEMCGYELREDGDWTYADVFDHRSQRLHAILV